MATLTITRGLPGSGKTTLARIWVAEDPKHRARVNRDDMRALLHDGFADQEVAVTTACHAAISALLNRGIDVICDDTNLRSRTARELRRLAQLAGAGFDVIDLTNVRVDVCVSRDAGRADRTVGEDVIVGMYRRYVAGQPYPLALADEDALHPETAGPQPYEPVPGTPKAVLVDIDGTVALKGARSPYDETRVHEDRPNTPVIRAVLAMVHAGHRVIFCSGRTGTCREATEEWLGQHYPYAYEALHMRAAGDTRKDSIVKLELFDQHIRNNYDVAAVFDDRDQVVAMWRALGLTVFQVAEGNF